MMLPETLFTPKSAQEYYLDYDLPEPTQPEAIPEPVPEVISPPIPEPLSTQSLPVDTVRSPLTYIRRDWKLHEYPDLTPEIEAVKQKIQAEKNKHISILRSEEQHLKVVEKAQSDLEAKVQREYLLGEGVNPCMKQRISLEACLRYKGTCPEEHERWRQCEVEILEGIRKRNS
jgi:hypothetical protein